MKVILLAILILIISIVVGIATLAVLHKKVWNNGNIDFFEVPLIGLLVITSVIEVMGLFIPVKYSVWIFTTFIVIIIILYRNEFGKIYTLFKEQWIKIFVYLIPIITYTYPVWNKNSLASVRVANNDLIFYLSDMDWISEYTLFQTPVFSDTKQYYTMTYTMYERYSRLGFDYCAAFFKCLLNLEAHQVFTAFCIVIVAIMGGIIVSFLKNAVRAKKRTIVIAYIFSVFSMNSVQMIAMQYGPQLMGICCLMGVLYFSTMLFKEKEKKWIFLTALSLSGIISCYTEFVVHILIIYGISFFICCIYEKCIKINFLVALKTGLLALGLNIVGTFRTVGYFLFLLTQLQETGLNPEGWEAISGVKIYSVLLGLLHYQRDSSMIFKVICGVLLGIVIISSFSLLLKWKKCYEIWSVTGCIVGLILYLLYFVVTDFGYGEYKAITGIATIVTVFTIFSIIEFIALVFNKINSLHRLVNIITIMLVSGIIFGNVYQIKNYYPIEAYSYYDDELLKLRNMVSYLPEDIVYSFDGGNNYDETHKVLYALKDSCVLLKGNSYFKTFFKDNLNDISISLEKDIYIEKNDIIMQSEQYYLTKQSEFKVILGDGFHSVEVDSTGTSYRWTSDNKSTFSVMNIKNTSEKFEISIDLGNSPEGVKHVALIDEEGNVLDSGVTPITLSATLELASMDMIVLTVVSEESLTYVNTGDTRAFGVKCSNINIINCDEFSYELGTVLLFSASGNGECYTVSGFCEAEDWGTWTSGTEAKMKFKINSKKSLLHGILVARVFNEYQDIEIYVNGRLCYSEVVKGGNIEFYFDNTTQDNLVEVLIKLPSAISPLEVGMSNDARILALGFIEMIIGE